MNAQGTILSNPILKNGYNWYNVNYDVNPDGWSADNWLEKVSVVMHSSIPSGISSSTNTAEAVNALTPEQRQALIASLLNQLEALKQQIEELRTRGR